jgi:4-amino-4-deoxy-L-arabinose transferase-like glycosyltransferase
VLWQRVLFPGTADTAPISRRLALLVLVLLPATLLYPCLAFRLFEPDESRYAEIAREMLRGGDWIVPHLQNEPYLDKPPLLYWLVGASFGLLGMHDWSARLVPALAVHACILITYWLGRRSLGDRAAFGGALLLALAPGFLGMGRLLLLDGLLALWVALALLGAFEAVRGERLLWRWWLPAAAAAGLGILTKGPVALLLLVPPLWGHRLLADRSCRIPWLAHLTFAAVVLAIAVPWYVAVCLRAPGFAGYFLWEHNVLRFLSPFDHLEPVWYYGPVVLAGLLPGTLWAISFIRFLLSGRTGVAQRRCPELGFMLLAGGWGILFFTLSGCKLPTYVLPAFPLLCLALGYHLAGAAWRASRLPALAAGCTFVLVGLGHYVVVPWYAWYRSPMGQPALLAHYCGDRQTPVVCYPRNCDSVAFYLSRDDFRTFRSKQIDPLRIALMEQQRTVMLFTHRHSLRAFRQALPPNLELVDETHVGLPRVPLLPDWLAQRVTNWTGETAWGLCDVAVVRQRDDGDSRLPAPGAGSDKDVSDAGDRPAVQRGAESISSVGTSATGTGACR